MRRDGFLHLARTILMVISRRLLLGWVFTDEAFAKNDFLTYGKFRFHGEQ
jgi:hypothetical protein